MVTFRVVDPASVGAQLALGHYFDELRDAFGFATGTALVDATRAYAPPLGLFVLAGPDDDPVACGAVQLLDDERGEIKRMWVAPSARGRGLAGALLAHLEGLVVEHGRHLAVLDTNSVLVAAVGLYESRGYGRIADYNGNVHADRWFARELDRP